jgi:hypothetical protein
VPRSLEAKEPLCLEEGGFALGKERLGHFVVGLEASLVALPVEAPIARARPSAGTAAPNDLLLPSPFQFQLVLPEVYLGDGRPVALSSMHQ